MWGYMFGKRPKKKRNIAGDMSEPINIEIGNKMIRFTENTNFIHSVLLSTFLCQLYFTHFAEQCNIKENSADSKEIGLFLVSVSDRRNIMLFLRVE